MALYATGTALRVGGDALLANPLRTLLSTIGVIIGVASLVAVLSLGAGMQDAARAQVERLTDMQTVSVVPTTAEQIDGQWLPVRNYPVFTPHDAADAATATRAIGMSLFVRAAMTVDYPQTGKRRATSTDRDLVDSRSGGDGTVDPVGRRRKASTGGKKFGRTIATNAGGLRMLRYGDTRAQLLGVEAVLGDGSVISHLGGLWKDNTGYDLSGLLCGSEGTLGVVTAARLALVPAV